MNQASSWRATYLLLAPRWSWSCPAFVDTAGSTEAELDERSRSQPSGRRHGVPSGSVDSCPPHLRPALLSPMSREAARPRAAGQPRGSRAPATACQPTRVPVSRSQVLGSPWRGQVEVHGDWPWLSRAARRGVHPAERAQLRLEGLNVLRLVPSRFLGRRLLPAGRDRLAEPTHVADRTPPFGPCEALSLGLRALSDAPRKREAPGSNPPGSSTTPPSSPSTSARATISSGARTSSSISSSGGHTWRTCSRSTRVATEPRSGPRTRLPGSSSRSGT